MSFFFLIIDFYFLIAAVIAQISNPIAELVIPLGIQTKEAKGKIEIHPVIVEHKYNLELYNLSVLFTNQFISIYFFN